MKKNARKSDTSNNDIIAEIDKRFERHTNVLMEKMDSTVKTATEQYSSLAKQMSEVKSDVNELKNDTAIIKPAVEVNSKDLKEIKSELHSMNMALMETSHETKNHEKRIKKIEEKVFV